MDDGAAAADGDAGEPPVHLALAHLGALTSLLQAIKVGAKQTCSVVIEPEGLWLRWEDDSKTLQSSVQLRSELFTTFECGQGKRAFGLSLPQLVDALSAFASAASAELSLRYPGPDGELQLEMVDAGDGVSIGGRCVMYARIATLEHEAPADMTDFWRLPASFFLVPGALLKEAVEDLEWPGGSVAVKLTRDPPAIALSSSGTGSLEVQLSGADLASFQVASASLVQRYKYKNLRAALASVPVGRQDATGSVSTKVSIDANGLLKVTHIVPLGGRTGHRAGGAGGGAPSFAPTPSALSAFTHTQTGVESSRMAAVIQFVALPVEEEE